MCVPVCMSVGVRGVCVRCPVVLFSTLLIQKSVSKLGARLATINLLVSPTPPHPTNSEVRP